MNKPQMCTDKRGKENNLSASIYVNLWIIFLKPK